MSTHPGFRAEHGHRVVSEAGHVAVDVANRLVAAVLLLLLLPLLLLVALAVAVSSRGPLLFNQVRVGQYGRTFHIRKFRTMRVGAEAELRALLAAEGVHRITPFVKLERDPRVTAVGSFLRKTSLDELPQLINVLRGEMRLVGPRPQTLAEVATYDDRSWRRLLVPPGITGLWQVSGRSDLTADEGLALDLDYVTRWTPALDARVLLQTPAAVLRQRGAY